MQSLIQPVAELLRRVAAEIVMPRFQNLRAGDIVEKTPGELVTVADQEAEAALSAGLSALPVDARVVGEEAVARDPSLLNGLGQGRVWIIDPIDGTANFAEGRSPFGLMIALADGGVVQAGWIYDPVIDRMCTATLGHGALVNGVRLHTAESGRARPVIALASGFMAEATRPRVAAVAAAHYEVVPIPRSAAENYPRVALGENDVGLFQRTLPWDHAAGTLFVTEAGGAARRWDGSDYRVGDDKVGLLIATTPARWAAAAALFLGPGLLDPATPGYNAPPV